MKKLIIMTAVAGMALGLSACGGGGGTKVVVTPPPPPADPNAKFGTAFAADFKKDPNSAPASVAAGDVVPVDPAATPAAVH